MGGALLSHKQARFAQCEVFCRPPKFWTNHFPRVVALKLHQKLYDYGIFKQDLVALK